MSIKHPTGDSETTTEFFLGKDAKNSAKQPEEDAPLDGTIVLDPNQEKASNKSSDPAVTPFDETLAPNQVAGDANEQLFDILDPESSREIKIGDIVAGRYRILSNKIGSGGFGGVYVAEQLSTARKVALKILNGKVLDDNDRENFLAESQALGRIVHDNVVGIIEAHADEDLAYLAMEYVPGKNLKQLMKSSRLPRDVKIRMGLQMALALFNTHTQGVLHRDLKPANILVADGGEVKLVDFGLTKLFPREQLEQKVQADGRVGLFVGSLPYSAPEGFRGSEELDERSDIYSLGIVLYELFHTYPFPQEGIVDGREYARLHKEVIPPNLRSVRPDVPEYLSKIIMKCLEKKPENRYQSIGELLVDWHKGSGRKGISKAGLVVWISSGAAAAVAAIIAGLYATGYFSPEGKGDNVSDNRDLGDNADLGDENILSTMTAPQVSFIKNSKGEVQSLRVFPDKDFSLDVNPGKFVTGKISSSVRCFMFHLDYNEDKEDDPQSKFIKGIMPAVPETVGMKGMDFIVFLDDSNPEKPRTMFKLLYDNNSYPSNADDTIVFPDGDGSNESIRFYFTREFAGEKIGKTSSNSYDPKTWASDRDARRFFSKSKPSVEDQGPDATKLYGQLIDWGKEVEDQKKKGENIEVTKTGLQTKE